MKAKNAKPGTRVVVKPSYSASDKEYLVGKHGTIQRSPSRGKAFDVEVWADDGRMVLFYFHELKLENKA